MRKSVRFLSPFIPYFAVLIGMYIMSSAWVAIVSYHIGMLATMIIWKSNRDNRRTPCKKSPLIYLTAIVFAAGGIILYLVWPYIVSDSSATIERLRDLGIGGHSWIYFAVYFCFVNSFIEEIFWRGYLADGRKCLHSDDLMFAGYHALVLAAFIGPLGVAAVFVACTFAAWLWRMLRITSGSLAIPMLTHFIADVGIIAAVHLRLYA